MSEVPCSTLCPVSIWVLRCFEGPNATGTCVQEEEQRQRSVTEQSSAQAEHCVRHGDRAARNDAAVFAQAASQPASMHTPARISAA